MLGFATDVMSCRYYREIIRALNKHCVPLFGFEKATVFFKDSTCKYFISDSIASDLFTVTAIQKRQMDTDGGRLPDTSFAYELLFPDDEIVVLPSELGMTGEVLRKNALKVMNNFGELLSADKKGGAMESHSSVHEGSELASTPLPLEGSLGHSVKTRNITSVTPTQALATTGPLHLKAAHRQLEQIIEDPNIESGAALESPGSKKAPLRARRAETKPLDESTPMKLH